MHSLLDGVLGIAEQAGALINRYYAGPCAVQAKADASPLTEADLAANALIVAALGAIAPWPVLSEESADVDWEQRRHWRRYWLVDPLDGTKEFLNRNGEFTVNIALIDGHRPCLGVVHAPALGRSYVGADGIGARRVEHGVARPISVARGAAGRTRVVGSRSHASAPMAHFLATLGEVDFVPVGSSLKFCLVAEGAADLYPRLVPSSEWDTAAAQCVLEQAGGQVIDASGAPLAYNCKASLRNPFFLASAGGAPSWPPR